MLIGKQIFQKLELTKKISDLEFVVQRISSQ